MGPIKVFIIQRQFPSYRKHIFDRLATRWELELLHGPSGFSIKGEEAGYARKVRYFKPFRNKNLIFLFCSLRILLKRPALVIHESGIGILSMWLTILICRLTKTKFILWGHGYNMKLGFDPSNSWESRIRLLSMKFSDGYLCYSQQGKELLAPYMDKNRIFVAQNSVDVEYLLQIREELKMQLPKRPKKHSDPVHLAFQGRLIAEKKPEHLVELYDYLISKVETGLTIHVIGGGPLLDDLKAKSANRNIRFYDSLYEPQEFGPILLQCSLMVNPGYVGLSILDGFCFELPLVTYKQGPDGPFHSPEIEYLQHGKTGFLIEEHSVEAMGDCIFNFIENDPREQFIENINQLLTKVNSTQMARGFFEAAENIVDRKAS